MVATAISAVSAFDAVGSLIVTAKFVCPPAAARWRTTQISRQIRGRVAFAVISAILGYVFAGYVPGWFGSPYTVTAAGMISTTSGLIPWLTPIFGPQSKSIGQGAEA